MKVKLNTIYASATLTGVPGQVIDVSPKEAKALIDAGYAASTEPVAAVKAKRGKQAESGQPGPDLLGDQSAQGAGELSVEQKEAKTKADELLDLAAHESDEDAKGQLIAQANDVLRAAGLIEEAGGAN